MTVEETIVCDVCGQSDVWTLAIDLDNGSRPGYNGLKDTTKHICGDHLDSENTQWGRILKGFVSRDGELITLKVQNGVRKYYVGYGDDEEMDRVFELYDEIG